MHYTCISCITIDSVLKIDKKIICKFLYRSVNERWKKILVSRFITIELKSESSDSDLGSEKVRPILDNEFMAKLEKSGSDSE